MPFTVDINLDCHARPRASPWGDFSDPSPSQIFLSPWFKFGFFRFSKNIYILSMLSNSLTWRFLEKYHVTFFVPFFFFFENLKYFNVVQISVPDSFQLLLCETGRQGPRQRLRLLLVCDDQGVKASAASSFRLHIPLTSLDLDSRGTLSPGGGRSLLVPFVLRGAVPSCGKQELRAAGSEEDRRLL